MASPRDGSGRRRRDTVKLHPGSFEITMVILNVDAPGCQPQFAAEITSAAFDEPHCMTAGKPRDQGRDVKGANAPLQAGGLVLVAPESRDDYLTCEKGSQDVDDDGRPYRRPAWT